MFWFGTGFSFASLGEELQNNTISLWTGNKLKKSRLGCKEVSTALQTLGVSLVWGHKFLQEVSENLERPRHCPGVGLCRARAGCAEQREDSAAGAAICRGGEGKYGLFPLFVVCLFYFRGRRGEKRCLSVKRVSVALSGSLSSTLKLWPCLLSDEKRFRNKGG